MPLSPFVALVTILSVFLHLLQAYSIVTIHSTSNCQPLTHELSHPRRKYTHSVSPFTQATIYRAPSSRHTTTLLIALPANPFILKTATFNSEQLVSHVTLIQEIVMINTPQILKQSYIP